MKYSVWFILLISFLPLASKAAVTINEIAWMGSADSANHEWIELYNDGSTVDVTNWTLSDSDNINIELTGQIAAGSYAVLERTSDESAPGTAFLLYTGALKNSGTTLTLRRADGGIEDQVNGGENWENLGGNNTTKATAQYTTAGWITAEATPGYQNKDEPSPSTEETKESLSGGKLAQSSEREPVVLKLPGVTLDLDILAPAQVFVNQPVEFVVSPSGVGNTIANSLAYSWNFGDMHVSTQKDPLHTYTYPGTYMLFVEAEYGRQKAQATKEITVLPVAISLTRNREGDVQINNDSPYEINLSEYRLRAGGAVELPSNTWLLPKQTITIPHTNVQATDGQLIALYDGVGQMVTSILPTSMLAMVSTPKENTRVAQYRESVALPKPASTDQSFRFVSEVQAADVPEEIQSTTTPPEVSIVNQTNDNKNPESTKNWPVIALVLLLSLGCIVVLMQPLAKSDSKNKHE